MADRRRLQSDYCYPGTDVLVNKFDIREPRLLRLAEGAVAGRALAELRVEPLPGKFDLDHMSRIHERIFEGVYPFAGKVRTEEIAKPAGDKMYDFAPTQTIERIGKMVGDGLRDERFLKGTKSIEQFAERAAPYFAAVNFAHPFQEGNGRTSREWLRTLAMNAGFNLDMAKLDKERWLRASVDSMPGADGLVKGKPFAAEIARLSLNREPEIALQRKFDGLDRGRGL